MHNRLRSVPALHAISNHLFIADTNYTKRFYDVPSDDPLIQGLNVNFKVTEPLKETMGSTWCGGSGYILRRAALEDIGGFPTESVGKDMYCSNILLGRGWDAIYVDEALQSGRVPESYKVSRDLPSKLNHVAGPSSTVPFVNVWTYCSTVVRRRIDVGFSHQLPAKGTTLSELESAMIDISRSLE